jgi:uncharacterized protein (TIGR02466 family)
MIEFEPAEIIPVFPTFIHKTYSKDLFDIDQLCKSLTQIRDLEDPNIACWQSNDQLHTLDQFKTLADAVLYQTEDILNGYGVIRDSHYITSMWGNIYDPNIAHAVHLHPNSYLSGVIYLNAPENCGPIIFHDPRPASNMIEFSYHSYNIRNGKTLIEHPENGMMLIWPSWLSHGVENGKCEKEEKRISIAFNVMLKGSVNIPTKRLVF